MVAVVIQMGSRCRAVIKLQKYQRCPRIHLLESHRIPIRKHHAIFDINVHITIGDLDSINDLPNINMRDARIRIRIRVFPDDECVIGRQTTTQVVLHETPSDLHRVRLRTEGKEPIGLYLIRTGAEDGVWVGRPEAERLASSDWTVRVVWVGKGRPGEASCYERD
jgi:hypothetical protein